MAPKRKAIQANDTKSADLEAVLPSKKDQSNLSGGNADGAASVERSTVDTRAPAETVITGNAPKAGYSKGANVSELQTEKDIKEEVIAVEGEVHETKAKAEVEEGDHDFDHNNAEVDEGGPIGAVEADDDGGKAMQLMEVDDIGEAAETKEVVGEAKDKEEEDEHADTAEVESGKEAEDCDIKKLAKKTKTSRKGRAAQSADGKKGGDKSNSNSKSAAVKTAAATQDGMASSQAPGARKTTKTKKTADTKKTHGTVLAAQSAGNKKGGTKGLKAGKK